MAEALRLGLIGAGRWGRNYIRTIANMPGARLARLGSGNPDSTSLVPAGCTVFADWREMLDAKALDGVIVATPPALHAEMALQAIGAGLPVLVEKPLSMDPLEARAIRDLAHSRGVLAMVGHTHLFHPAFRRLKAMQPELGAIREIRSEAGNFGPYRSDVTVLWDWGAHDVAMCLDLIGAAPSAASARVTERRQVEGGLGEMVEVALAFADGANAGIRIGNLAPKCRRFTVTCERGTLVYDDLAADKLVLTKGEGRSAIAIAADLPLAVVVAEFAAAIAAGSRDAASLELGVAVVDVLAACEAATRA